MNSLAGRMFVTGRSQNLQLTASGGTNKVQYLMSAGYCKQNGIIIYYNKEYKRINLRTNINAGITDRLTIATNIQFSFAEQDKLSSI